LAHGIPARLTAAEGRKFALTVGTAFLVLAGISWWRDHLVIAWIFAGVGVALWVAGLAIPGRLRPLYAAWMGLAHAISRVTTPIFMGIVYFVVMMPVGLLMRAVGRNPIHHRAANGSFWMGRTGPRGTLRNQF
jgi:hypothetical protein